jgi:hypothetical protein
MVQMSKRPSKRYSQVLGSFRIFAHRQETVGSFRKIFWRVRSTGLQRSSRFTFQDRASFVAVTVEVQSLNRHA